MTIPFSFSMQCRALAYDVCSKLWRRTFVDPYEDVSDYYCRYLYSYFVLISTYMYSTCASLVPSRISRPGVNTATHRSGSFLDRKLPKFAARSLVAFRIINHPKR